MKLDRTDYLVITVVVTLVSITACLTYCDGQRQPRIGKVVTDAGAPSASVPATSVSVASDCASVSDLGQMIGTWVGDQTITVNEQHSLKVGNELACKLTDSSRQAPEGTWWIGLCHGKRLQGSSEVDQVLRVSFTRCPLNEMRYVNVGDLVYGPLHH